mmetsp:Transcript_18096/g.32814  ORF Transcript_18096/g.32814 Transcript_18096/m.32814 type:complete len:233 (-) Transcript_18096:2489-3187(-)
MFRLSSDKAFNAFRTSPGGLFPLVPNISLFRYFPGGSLITIVPLKSRIMTRRDVTLYALNTESESRCVNATSCSLARNDAVVSISSSRCGLPWGENMALEISWSEAPNVESRKSRNTFLVQVELGHVDTKSRSRVRRPSFSCTSIVRALSMQMAEALMSKGFNRRAPFKILQTAENSDAITTPGISGACLAQMYSSGDKLSPSRSVELMNTSEARHRAKRLSMGKEDPLISS